jgi:hypothetical protein
MAPSILKFLDGLGCQQFIESEVIQFETIAPPTRFASLVKVPQSKWNFISDLVTDTSVIPWERREKLARQVVEGVQQLHSKSFVVGMLWRSRQPIIVDIFDRVHFWTFDKQFVPYTSRSCYPPEYAQF